MSSVKSASIAAAPRPYEGFNDQYISGRWRAGKLGTVLVDTDPYTGNTLVEIPDADASDLDEACRAAEHAQRLWATTAPHERAQVMARAAEIMKARHDEILDWLISEAGSTRAKAEIEWHFTVGITQEAATFPHRTEGRLLPSETPGKESRAYRQPLGVVGVISPWNFPLYLTQRSVAPALALGNAVVIKPAGETPVTGGLLLAKIFEEAGLPAGLLNVVIGPAEEIGDAFTLHPVPRMISFTGSTRIGRRVGSLAMTAPQIKRVALELGGNAPLVVLDDADLEHAVRSAVVGRFLHQGQICMSSNRIIVDAKVHDEFVERFVAHVRTLKYGDPRDPDVSIGPVISQKQLTAHLAMLKLADDAGARRVLGGEAEGLVLPPHVFVDVKNDSIFAQSEMFGPIAPIIKVSGDKEALRVANETEFGLSSAVFTQDQERGVRFALGIEAGMTHINDHSVDDSRSGPFGGEKNSGLGRFGGEWILHELTRDHWVTIQHNKGPYPF
ncbi:aldehyde dehydrogenase family protein [Pseudomonas sp. CHM02]|uniref:aldehyde dehydrogenase family protein n=1 Tax=Pseudomonas sp. CHM02 TaxID=1463662 RepID=UPI0004701CEC|nr:aldehyde dehydrogenase family protein [Pseudomonas sp. CHM02]